MSRELRYKTDYNYKLREFNQVQFNSKNDLIRTHTLIAVIFEKLDDGSFLFEPTVNSFLNEGFWSNVSLNTQKKTASVICEFMNFCRFNTLMGNNEFLELNQGLHMLKFKHGSLFLEEQLQRYYSGEVKRNTVLEKEFPLIEFYHYLLITNLIDEGVKELIEYDKEKSRGRKVSVKHNPFTGLNMDAVSLPKKEYRFQNVRDFTNDSPSRRTEVIHLLVSLAEEHYPDISLLLCFMLYGGLRIGEAVNITKATMEMPKFYSNKDIGESGFLLKVIDNPELFKGLKNLSSNQVKRALPYVRLSMNDISFVSEIYQNHKKRIICMEKKGFISNKKALFINSYNGGPLNKAAAASQFRKLVDKFVDKLVELGDIETLEIITDSDDGKIKVTPHLCRAVFTNMLIDLGYSMEEIRIMRGDLTDDAIKFYWNLKKVKKVREDTVEKMQRTSLGG